MAELNSLEELGECFARAADLIDSYVENYLKNDLLPEVVTSAKAKLGTYQSAVGPFPAWDPLAVSTMRIREALGATPNDPLLRFGQMHDETFGILQSSGPERYLMTVGSEADYAWRQELGDGRTPPRPWLGPALFEACRHVEIDLEAVIYTAFVEAFG